MRRKFDLYSARPRERFHAEQGRLVTLTAVRPPPRFGEIVCEENMVTRFDEKPLPTASNAWISGGFFVMSRDVIDLLGDDESILERNVLPRLAVEGQLAGYQHTGFWQCMDTIHDKRTLDAMWLSGSAPWKVWAD